MTTLELENIHKSFPGAHVLRGVDLVAHPGRVHALLGENGAGKSTLIKIAAGALQPDAGRILIDGRPTKLTPRAARQAGIRVLHQERQVLHTRSVADNVLLDRVPRNSLGIVTSHAVHREASRRLAAVGVDLDPAAQVGGLSVAQLQLLELARAVNVDARCIIMDEPTASLHRDEVSTLFSVVRRIRDAGIAVIYISHHLDEVMELADDYTVLRDGTPSGRGLVADVKPSQLINSMFGTEVSLRREDVIREESHLGGTAIELDRVSYGASVQSVSLKAVRGEVLVVTGAVGCGSREIARLMVGATSPSSGAVRVNGRRGLRRRAAAQAGVAFLPANRKLEGVMLDLSVVDNALLAETGMRRGLSLFVPHAARKRAENVCRKLSVRMADGRAPIRSLSGGNQQKVVLARWVNVGSDVLVLEEPTTGVDIPSKFEIYRMLRQHAALGKAVVIFSTEYQEIRCVADRVLVMRDGRVIGEVAGERATEHELLNVEMGV